MQSHLLFFLLLATSITLKSSAQDSIHENNWATLLKNYVDKDGNVDYFSLKQQEYNLVEYLAYLELNGPEVNWVKEKKIAYWINVYNAYTIDLVLKNFPLKSILEINDGNPWDLKFIKVGSRALSLNDIEHEILRKQFQEPRIHFALNCASKSCPKLLNKPFKAETLNQQLETAAKAFINNEKKNVLHRDKVVISKIFDWYKDDFLVNLSLIEYLNLFSKININSNANVSFMEYDWNLNSK